MNQNEIRESINTVNEKEKELDLYATSNKFDYPVFDDDFLLALKKLIALAQQFLDVKGMPLKEYSTIFHDGFLHPHETPEDKIRNDTIDKCQLATAKIVMEKDKEIEKLRKLIMGEK